MEIEVKGKFIDLIGFRRPQREHFRSTNRHNIILLSKLRKLKVKMPFYC